MKPQTTMVLHMLRKAGDEGVGMGDFIQAHCLRYGARLDELRTAGYGIETVHLSGSKYVYRLTDEPDHEVGGDTAPAAPPSPQPDATPAVAVDPAAEPISLFDASQMELRRVGLFDLDEAA